MKSSLILLKNQASIKIKINAHWTTDIIRKVNAVKKIKSSQLLKFYEEIGLDDLRVKYGYKKTMTSISDT